MSRHEGTVVAGLPVTIHRREVLHFLEYPAGHEPPERIGRLVDGLLPEARRLVRGAGCYVRRSVEQAVEVDLEPVDADALVLGLVTVGGAIEQRVTELSDRGEVTRALILDAAGSAAAEEAADRLGAQIAAREGAGAAPGAAPRGEGDRVPNLPCRLSPGYGRWPVTAQRSLFPLLPHDELGVILLPSCLMVPRKSISFAMWLGARGRIAEGLAGCSRCQLEHCRYRRERGSPRSAESPAKPKSMETA